LNSRWERFGCELVNTFLEAGLYFAIKLYPIRFSVNVTDVFVAVAGEGIIIPTEIRYEFRGKKAAHTISGNSAR
jgi:hypothetical protein